MKTYFLLLSASAILFSCSGSENGEEAEKSVLMQRIDSLEKKMFNRQNLNFDRTPAFETVKLYMEFAERFPDDSLQCAEYLFRCADLQSALGEHKNAISSLNKITLRNYKKYPECIFLQGYYYQEYLKDTVNAKIFYSRLIAEFPEHPFARDAKQLLSWMGKSDEEILQMFRGKENTEAKKK